MDTDVNPRIAENIPNNGELELGGALKSSREDHSSPMGKNSSLSSVEDSPEHSIHVQSKNVEHNQNTDYGWYNDVDQLTYLSMCSQSGTLPSGYFLRKMKDEVLDMKCSLLGNGRFKPIFNSMGGNTHITKINLSGAQLTDESVSDLCNMFKDNYTIKDVNLSDNQFSSKYAENICDVLGSSTQLERIDLHGNRFCDKSAVYFSELMATSLRMSYLNLSYNDFGSISGMLFGRVLPQATSLVELDLSWNRLGGDGMRQFCKGLTENRNIEILSLAFNGIGPRSGCRDLAVALKGNKALRFLDLSGNRISPEGAVLFSKGLQTNTTLTNLFLRRNPLQSSGCYALLKTVVKNANSGLLELDLRGSLVNDDFRQLQDFSRIKRPELIVRAGDYTTEKTRAISSKWKSTEVTPKQMIERLGTITRNNILDALYRLDKTGQKRITREAFIPEVYKYLSKLGIDFSEEEMKKLMLEVDPGTEEEIDLKTFAGRTASTSSREII